MQTDSDKDKQETMNQEDREKMADILQGLTKGFAAVFNQNEEFMKYFNNMVENLPELEKHIENSISRYLKEAKMPTKEEIEIVFDKLDPLSDKLDLCIGKLDKLIQKKDASSTESS